MLKTFTLKNGLKVATYSIPQMKSVFISESVKGGSIFDTPKTSGLAHFMEHILIEGTPTFGSSEAIYNFIEGLAGSFNAMTAPQMIRFYINGPANHLEDMLKVSHEVFFKPLFPETGIEKERGAILEEIWQRQGTDWYKRGRFFSSVRYKKGHPFLLDSGGSEEIIKKLQKKDLVNFWSIFFHPKNTYLVVVGGFDTSIIEELIDKFFSKYLPGKTFPGFPKLTNKDLTGRRVAIREDRTLNTCYIDLSFSTIPDSEGILKQVPQSIARSILGRLRVSRLYRLLRLQRGLVYGVDMGATTYEHFAYVYISTQTAPDKVEEVMELIIKELTSFLENGPTEEELNFAKNYTVNQILMQFDHPGNIASWIEGDLLWEDKIYTPDEYAKMIERVSKKDIMNFMKKYWDFSKLNLTIQGPIENSAENIKKFTGLLEGLKN